jgi:electron transport complex protein RnfB
MDGVPCDKCAPGGPKAAAAIAKIMGGEASAVEKKAVVQCQGSSEHCKPAYDYKGIQTCAAAATLYGGPKTCSFACIGLGDCTKVCKFDAIHIVDGVAKVDKDKCTGCGACANICPKQVIMIDAGGPRKPVVMCSNKDKGAVANKLCTTSCIACGMCERTCKFDAIHVVDGVARVDYDKCKGCGMCAQKCPKRIILFPLKDDPYPPKPVVKPAAPAAKPEAKAEEAKPETKAE